MILPGFGMISHVISTFSKKPVFGYLGMAWAMIAIGVIGFVVCGPTTCTPSASIQTRAPTSQPRPWSSRCRPASRSSRGSPPCGGGSIEFKTPMLFAIGFIFLFTVGGVHRRGALERRRRYCASQHLLRDCAFPLRAKPRRRLLDVRGLLLLVRKDVGSAVSGMGRPGPFLDNLHRRERDVLPDAFPGSRRYAAPLRGLPGGVRRGWNYVASIGAFISYGSTIWFVLLVLYTLFAGKRSPTIRGAPVPPRSSGPSRHRRRSIHSRNSRW